MVQVIAGTVEVVARLLQDPRVRATINVQDKNKKTALYHACATNKKNEAASKVHLLLQAGADLLITHNKRETPLDVVRQRRPTYHATIALLEQYPVAKQDAEKASILVMTRLAAAATRNTVAPSCLKGRLPHVTLAPLTAGQNDGEERGEEGEEGRKLRTTVAFLCGVGREGMPEDVFEDVFLELLQPSWDPHWRKMGGPGRRRCRVKEASEGK
jgi:hypothetical protein